MKGTTVTAAYERDSILNRAARDLIEAIGGKDKVEDTALRHKVFTYLSNITTILEHRAPHPHGAPQK